MEDNTGKVTIDSIVDKLIDTASEIVDHKIRVAMGIEPKENAYQYNSKEMEWVMDHVRPMIKQANQARKVEAESSHDIILLLSKGEITIKEATELMAILKLQVNTEEKEMNNKLQKVLLNMVNPKKQIEKE